MMMILRGGRSLTSDPGARTVRQIDSHDPATDL